MSQMQQPPDDFWQIPDDSAFNQQMASEKQYVESQSRSRSMAPKVIKHAPPAGARAWRDARTGESVTAKIWLCPWRDPKLPLGHRYLSHFQKSHKHPMGMRIACNPDKCLICQAAHEMRYRNNVDEKKRWCRQKREYFYNAIWLDNPDAHTYSDKDGSGETRRCVMIACNIDANSTLNALLHAQGPQVTHPLRGSPIMYGRQKIGPGEMQVGYTFQVCRPEPLDPHWHPLCRPDQLWDFTAEYKPSTPDEQAQFLTNIQVDLPQSYGMPVRASSPQEVGPPAAYGVPDVPPMPKYGAEPPAPQRSAPPPPPPPPPQPTVRAPMPNDNLMQMPQWDDAPPPGEPYRPPQAQPMPPAPPAQQRPVRVVASPDTQRRLVAPLAPNEQLPGQRERCFGRHDPGYQMCQTCPPWIKSQCVPQTSGYQPQDAGVDQRWELEQRMRRPGPAA